MTIDSFVLCSATVSHQVQGAENVSESGSTAQNSLTATPSEYASESLIHLNDYMLCCQYAWITI